MSWNSEQESKLGHVSFDFTCETQHGHSEIQGHMLSENFHVTPLPLRTDISSCFELVYFDDIICL
jgi:hypothetical protein